jgi:uncharacterized GH25 family protein
MKLKLFVLAALGLAAVQSPVLAHFVWITVAKDSAGQPQAQVHFSEMAEPDAANLLDRVAAVKVWSRTATGKPAELKLTKQITDEVGSWVSAVPEKTAAVSGSIKYGVLERRGMVFLLFYHAKYLDAGAADFKALARDEALALDVVPHAEGKGYALEVLFQGKPVEGSEVVVLDPESNERALKTDAKGRVTIDAKPGLYSIRAKWTLNEAGKEGDKEYPQVNHYSTLALRVPAAK